MSRQMAHVWRSLAFADVSRPSLEQGLREQGLDWRTSLHVTATGSLARAMRGEGWPAISIKDLSDMLIWSGMPGEFALPASLPSPVADISVFDQERKKWRRRLKGKSIALAADAGQELRRFLDAHADRVSARVLRHSAADLLLSIRSLASAGVYPHQLDVTHHGPLIDVAVQAWKGLEAAQPHLFRAREDLWSPEGATTARLISLLGRLFGDSSPWSILYHGFYFFTPPQWAWFRLLRDQTDANQYFVLHDDGGGRVYEVWRHFFDGRWDMPPWPSERVSSTGPLGDRLREALDGTRVDVTSVAATGPRVKLTVYRDVAEFASDARQEREQATEDAPFSLFAADAKDIDRVARRFGLGSVASADLADTPLGQFLIALHSCVRVDADGHLRFTLDGGLLLDMASSGCLDEGDDHRPSRHIAAIRRAIPFFEGLQDLDDWADRARSLEGLIASTVSAHGMRASSASDLTRMVVAVRNPLTLAPWCDLTDDEVVSVRNAIERVKSLVARLTSPEATSLNQYLAVLRRELKAALKLLPKASLDAIAVARKRESLTGSRPLDIEGIIDHVSMHLSRGIESLGDDDEQDEDAAVEELRNADALAFSPHGGAVHVTNLADTSFPSRAATIGWPFDRSLLAVSSVRAESREISQAREESSGLADLYLFWLALHSVRTDGEIHLSSIAELGAEKRNPSPLLLLIAELDAGRNGEHVVGLAGGFEVGRGTERAHADVVPGDGGHGHQPPARSDAAIAEAIRRVDPVAAASAVMCPRRFPLQWILGLTHSFPAPFQHKMLFGNVAGALSLEDRFQLSEAEALEVARDLWRHLTPGERLSSLRKRRIYPSRPWTPPGADPRDNAERRWTADFPWIFTLGGTKDARDLTSQAYDAARLANRPSPARVAPPDDHQALLPTGNPDFELCKMCPVRPACSKAILVRER